MSDDSSRRKAREIGDAALDFESGSERDAFIAERCGDDEELKAQVLTYVDGADDPVFVFTPPVARADPRTGQTIGRWTLSQKLGEGGLGVVYLAERCDGEVRQRGAIKFLRGTVRSRDLEMRFRDERQILANLHHPYIVGLLDGGVTSEGQPYLVMELVEDGQPLDVYCWQRGLAVKECLDLFQKVCQAVSYAHQRLVVHRDLKPGNILVSADGVPHLLDFGVAKILDPIHRAGSDRARSTRIQMGTERYFSPEQARLEPLDTSTDVYSLGVILYELLAGTDPYNFDSRVKEHVEHIICNVDPELPSRAVARTSVHGAPDVGRRRRELTGDLDAILMQALRKERDKRYASVAELSGDLQRHLDQVPVQARLNTFTYRLSRFVRRNRERVIASALVLAILIGGLVTTTYQRGQALYERQLANARELASYANQFMPGDPQRALALAIYAVEATYPKYGQAVPAAKTALYDALWLAPSGSVLQGARGGDAIAFSADGKLLATVDGAIIGIWSVDSGKQLRTLVGENERFTSVAFSPDNKLMAAGGPSQPARIWDVATRRQLRTFGSRIGSSADVSFSPDGKLVSAVDNGTAHVWDLDSGRQVFMVGIFHGSEAGTRDRYALESVIDTPGHEDVAGWARFLAVGESGVIRDQVPIKLSWDTSQPGRRLFASVPGVAAEWDVDTGKESFHLSADGSWVEPFQAYDLTGGLRVVLSANGGTFASMSYKAVSIWHSTTDTVTRRGARLWRRPGSPDLEEALVWISPAAVSDAMFSADGNRIVTVDANHAITFSELQTGAQLLTTYGNHAALSQDGMWLATSDEDHGITLWNVSAKQQPFTFPSVRGDGEVAFSRDSQRIAVAILDRALVWSTKTGQLLLDAPATPHSRVEQFSISADGKRFAMIDDSGSVRILDFDTGRIIQSVGRNPSNGGSHTNRACRLAWSDDGKRLATMDDRSIDLWDAVTGAKLFTLDQHAPRAGHVPLLAGNAEDEKTPAGLAIGFARDGKSIATCWRGVASVWDTSTGRRLRKLTSNDFLDRTELSPDGSRLLTCAEGEAKIWDLTEGRLSLTFAGRDALSSAVFSPDGKRVAGLGAKALRIWDAVTGAPLETIEGKFSSPTFSPDGFTIAAGAADGTVRIWDTATGEELLTLHGHPSQVWHVSNQELPEPAGAAGFAFSSDGKQLAVGGTPYLRVYAIDTNDVLKLARERLFRPLSAEDCRKFLHTQSCPAF